MRQQQFPHELGEVNIGDIIVGKHYSAKLMVIQKNEEYDGVWSYLCKYIEGVNDGETTYIMSYFDYTKVS